MNATYASDPRTASEMFKASSGQHDDRVFYTKRYIFEVRKNNACNSKEGSDDTAKDFSRIMHDKYVHIKEKKYSQSTLLTLSIIWL